MATLCSRVTPGSRITQHCDLQDAQDPCTPGVWQGKSNDNILRWHGDAFSLVHYVFWYLSLSREKQSWWSSPVCSLLVACTRSVVLSAF